MIATAPAAQICGEVRTVGSAPDLLAVMSHAGETIALGGPTGNELIGYGGTVCVTGVDRGIPWPGTSSRIVVTSYRLVGDGKHAPIVGTIRKCGAAYFIETHDKRRLRVVANDTTTLASVVDHLVWLSATWSDGALYLMRIGPLGR